MNALSVYEKVRDICYERHISIAELERRAGVSNGTIGSWKKGEPRLSTFKKVCKALRVDADSLMD